MNPTTFDRRPNGQFTPQIPTPEPGAGTGEAALILAVGALVGAGAKAAWDYFFGDEEAEA